MKKQKELFENLVYLIDQLPSEDKQKRLAAVNGLKEKHRNGELPPQLISTIVAVIANDSDKEVSEAGAYFFDLAVKKTSFGYIRAQV